MNRFMPTDVFIIPIFKSKLIIPLCWTFTILLICLTGSISYAAGIKAPSISPAEAKPFEYILSDRADPFVPFITEKAAASTVDMNEIVEKDFQLTGMQLFEPGQLNLVALLQSGDERIAMVEDFTGKGYVITKGIKIGRKGVVKDIASNTVIIEETAETRAGKKIVTKVVMTLKKEGEE